MDVSRVGGEGLFSAEEVGKWIEKFLQKAGYSLLPLSDEGLGRVSFLAECQFDGATHRLAGSVCQNIEDAPRFLTELKEKKAITGEQSDYVLAFPPVSEYFMIELLTRDQGQWYFDIKQERFMVWLCNPERETTTCLLGASEDDLLSQHFVNMGTVSFDVLIGMRLSQMILAEEEEETRESS